MEYRNFHGAVLPVEGNPKTGLVLILSADRLLSPQGRRSGGRAWSHSSSFCGRRQEWVSPRFATCSANRSASSSELQSELRGHRRGLKYRATSDIPWHAGRPAPFSPDNRISQKKWLLHLRGSRDRITLIPASQPVSQPANQPSHEKQSELCGVVLSET